MPLLHVPFSPDLLVASLIFEGQWHTPGVIQCDHHMYNGKRSPNALVETHFCIHPDYIYASVGVHGRGGGGYTFLRCPEFCGWGDICTIKVFLDGL